MPYLKDICSKWSTALSSIGREPYNIGDICSIEEGGAINALGKKELLHLPTSRYYYGFNAPNTEYHVDPEFRYDQLFETQTNTRFIDPDPKEAKRLINAAIGSLNDIRLDDVIDGISIRGHLRYLNKEQIILELKKISENLPGDCQGENFTSVQKELSSIARRMIGIEFELKSSISKLESGRYMRGLKDMGKDISSSLKELFE